MHCVWGGGAIGCLGAAEPLAVTGGMPGQGAVLLVAGGECAAGEVASPSLVGTSYRHSAHAKPVAAIMEEV
jgi:hypothetical protein